MERSAIRGSSRQTPAARQSHSAAVAAVRASCASNQHQKPRLAPRFIRAATLTAILHAFPADACRPDLHAGRTYKMSSSNVIAPRTDTRSPESISLPGNIRGLRNTFAASTLDAVGSDAGTLDSLNATG